MPNGVAYADGSLKIGDILLKIDGENVANGKHKKVVKLLQKATGHVILGSHNFGGKNPIYM